MVQPQSSLPNRAERQSILRPNRADDRRRPPTPGWEAKSRGGSWSAHLCCCRAVVEWMARPDRTHVRGAGKKAVLDSHLRTGTGRARGNSRDSPVYRRGGGITRGGGGDYHFACLSCCLCCRVAHFALRRLPRRAQTIESGKGR